MDLSVNIMHLKHPLILVESEGSALTFSSFLLSPYSNYVMLCPALFFINMTGNHFLQKSYGTEWLLCNDVS